jgi:Flp pilus assembly protein CpaB
MRSRGLVVAIAIVLAVAAAAAVVLYTQGVKSEAEQGSNLRPVIVSIQDIPANQQLDPLIEDSAFKEIRVPATALVNGAVTSIDELRGATTSAPILANEQIPTSRLSTGDPLNKVGVSAGHVAVSVELDAPQGGVGTIQPGDNVTVYATYQGVEVIGANLAQVARNPAAIQAAPRGQLPPLTLTLIPTVRVLKIQNPPVDVETGRTDSSRIQVTLDLEPKDAQALVFAQENARIWLGLLPPGEDGTHVPASDVPLELAGAQRR